ncbi:MAG: hypothetical protein H6729_00260 [Deltaproteobacteria bacterium]|nr:hypothetical protein [Deltaproteobacteria bacterium]
MGRLDVEAQEGWHRAISSFRALSEQGPRVGLRIRYALVTPGVDLDEHLGPVDGGFFPALADAAAAYRACFWPTDDRRNRAWIGLLIPLLKRAEPLMVERLSNAHQRAWPPEKIAIDVVEYANFGGANTVVNPNHILMSSVAPGFDGFGGIECVFHEATHVFVGPRSGGSIAALSRAAERRGVILPRDLWHVVLFVSAGEAARATIADLWNQPYEPYIDSQGLFARAWPELRTPVETWWLPYLHKEISLEEASDGLVRALSEGATGLIHRSDAGLPSSDD